MDTSIRLLKFDHRIPDVHEKIKLALAGLGEKKSSTMGRFGKEPIRAQHFKFQPIREPYLAHVTRLAVRSIFGDWYPELG